jgi:phosphomannomutase
VGEVNVVREMKSCGAVIGGEGNGGIICPELHYGRDALIGIALFLSCIARRKVKCSELRQSFPQYFMAKKKLTLDPSAAFPDILNKIKENFKGMKIDERDGMKIEQPSGWVHIRKSNTEPVIRIYAEGISEEEADNLADNIIEIIQNR